MFKNKGEIYFRFLLKNKADQKALTRRISIDHVRGDSVWAFASKRGMLGFFELGYTRFTLLNTPAEQFQKSQKEKVKGQKSVNAFDSYPTYSQYEQVMQQFESDYPSICKLVNLGTLPSGRKILALHITDSVFKKEPEPQFLYTSTMHGDETAGYPMMLKLADYLLGSYGTNFRTTHLINHIDIWINPLANPDGLYRSGNNTVAGASRYNAANVDLNRNYPDPEDGPHPDGNPYQPETKIFMAFADSMDFVMAANFHGGSEVANFPWDTWQRRHADEAWWTTESVRWVDSARAHAPANYFNEVLGYPNLPGVVQGYDWYEVNGGRQDYMNWFKGCREFTVELSDTKLLPENQLEAHWQYNMEGLLNYMEASLYGITGIVTDQCTGKPVRAKIFILNHDKDSSHIYSSARFGNYHRPISPGTYTVQYSAPGYQTVTINNVSVGNQTVEIQNLALQPIAPGATFSFKKMDLCSPVVQFFDQSGSASQWRWYFGDGDSATTQNPQHQYNGPGPYTVTLKASNCAGASEVTKTGLIEILTSLVPTLVGDTSLCGAKPHLLTALNAPFTEWYANATGGNPLDTAAIFTTTPLAQTTTFYAQSFVSLPNQKVGPASNLIGAGGFFTGNTYHYLIFDAHKSFTLKSVMVYANTAGNRTIQLRNAQGQVLKSVVVAVPSGASRIILNISVPAGEGLQLGTAGGNANNLFRNQNGALYPYEVNGLVTINGNSAGEPGYYYFFYDWEIASRCQSERLPVTAFVENAPVPTALIAAENNPVCQGDTAVFSVSFANGGLAPQFSWFVGNVLVSNGQTFKSSTLSQGAAVICKVLSSDTCSVNNPATSNQLIANILPRPGTPILQLANGTLYSSSPSGNSWYLNGVLIPGASADSLIPLQTGVYSVKVMGGNGCVSLPSELIPFTPTGNIMGPGSIVMKFSDNHLMIDNQKDRTTARVYDMQGRQLLMTNLPEGVSTFSTKNWPKGKYVVVAGASFFSFLKTEE